MKNIFPLLLFLVQTIYAQIVVNEYSAANYSDITDNYGDYEDWFELYNTSGVSIDLDGYYLSDKANNLTKYQINSLVTIQANDHILIYASGRDEINGANIHTNFKIHQTKGNEWVILTDPDGLTIIDSVFVRPCLTNHSRGRMIDGDSDWGVFTNPSPNNANNNGLNDYTETPQFSLEPGNYSNTVNLGITISQTNTTIHYTIDGSLPTDASAVYTAPISINNTTVIKAMAISTDVSFADSFIEYGTFFINDTHTVAVLSISGNQVENLLNGQQIDPQGTFEYYKEGVLVDKARGEFNKHGNDSWAYAQRGFDYITRDQFGYNYAIKDEIFRNKDRDKFQRLIIKAAANDNYPFSYGGSGAHIRDAYVQSLSQTAELRMDERSFEACIVYLNGEYWGLYEIREKVDDIDFTDYYYDQDAGNVDFLKTWGGTWIEYGTDTGWVNIRNFILSNDMAAQSNYDHAKTYYNTGSLIDYYILNSYIVNADWLNWNTAWWRGTDPDGDKKKWRYALWDMDNTFDHGTNYTGVPSQNANADPCDPEGIGNPGGQGHIPIWNAFLQSDEFFADYINRWSDLSNTHFSCDFMVQHLDSLIDIIEPEMNGQIDRWGGNYNTWQGNVQDMRNFIEERCTIINAGLLDCYEDDFGIEGPYDLTLIIEPLLAGEVVLNTLTIEDYPFTGIYFGGINQELSAIAAENYIFSSWESTSGINFTDNSELTFPLTGNDTIIVHFEHYHELTINVEGPGEVILNGEIITSFPFSSFVYGDISVEAITPEGYVFSYWELTSGDISSTITELSIINLNEDATLTAYFVPSVFDVLFNISNPASADIIVNGEVLSSYPQEVSITWGEINQIELNIAENYVFDHWESANDNLASEFIPSYSLTLYEPDTLTAFLDRLFHLSLKVEPQNSGQILIDGDIAELLPQSYEYIEGAGIDLEAIANPDYEIKYWIRNQAILGTQALFPYTISQDDTLKVLFTEKEVEILLPNSFSPNGDQLNDIFKPISDGSKIRNYSMLIYNEWGELVFETHDFEIGWNGVNTQNSEQNIFIYKIQAYSLVTGGKISLMGTVLVL